MKIKIHIKFYNIYVKKSRYLHGIFKKETVIKQPLVAQTVISKAFLTTSSSSFSFRFFSKRYFSAFLAAFFCAAFFWGLAFIAAVLLSWLQILPDLYCRRGNPCLELAHRILTRKMVCPMYSFLNMECPLSLIS